MRGRCNNLNHSGYPSHGAQGVKVDPDFDSFDVWLAYVETLPNCVAGRQLDRYPDKDGDYTYGNMRWATLQEQAANKRMYKNNKSGYRGVSKPKWTSKKNPYQVQINYKGTIKSLGCFSTAIAGAKARDKYIKEHKLNLELSIKEKEKHETDSTD